MKNQTQKTVLLALLIALNIILSRFLAIPIGTIIRISFGFIPIIMMGFLFGPLYAGIGAGIADIIGTLMFPTMGPYFPGFTLSAITTGVIYGLVFYKKVPNIKRIVFANFLVIVIVHLSMNALWLSMITGKAFMVLLVPKIVKSLAMLPIESFLIVLTYKYLYPYIAPSVAKP